MIPRARPAGDGSRRRRRGGGCGNCGRRSSVSRRTRIGLDASFFDLGGHSISAIRLVNRVREVFGADYPLTASTSGRRCAPWRPT